MAINEKEADDENDVENNKMNKNKNKKSQNDTICMLVPELCNDVSLIIKALDKNILERIRSTLNKHSGKSRKDSGVNVEKALDITARLFT